MGMLVLIEKARLAFPDVFEPKQYQGKGPFRYTASLLMREDAKVYVLGDGTKTEFSMGKVISEVAQDKWGKGAAAALKTIDGNIQKTCWYSGDLKSDYEGFEGVFVLSTVRPAEKGAPEIVDRDKSRLTEASGKIYSGAVVNALVDIWAQSNDHGKGIRASLNGIQFVEHGDAAVSRVADVSAFDDLSVPELATEDMPF